MSYLHVRLQILLERNFPLHPPLSLWTTTGPKVVVLVGGPPNGTFDDLGGVGGLTLGCVLDATEDVMRVG